MYQTFSTYLYTSPLPVSLIFRLSACGGTHDSSLKDLHPPSPERRTLCRSLKFGTGILVQSCLGCLSPGRPQASPTIRRFQQAKPKGAYIKPWMAETCSQGAAGPVWETGYGEGQAIDNLSMMVCHERSAKRRTSAIFAVAKRTRYSGTAMKISLKISPAWVRRFSQAWSCFNELSWLVPRHFSKPRNPAFTTPDFPSHGPLIVWRGPIRRCFERGIGRFNCWRR